MDTIETHEEANYWRIQELRADIQAVNNRLNDLIQIRPRSRQYSIRFRVEKNRLEQLRRDMEREIRSLENN